MSLSRSRSPARPINPTGPGTLRPDIDRRRSEIRAADRELFKKLKACDFDEKSEAWLELAWEMCEYATGVLVPWALAGTLRSKAMKYPGGSRLPESLDLDNHAARALVNEVLEVALPRFLTTSLPAWDPDGGAGLATWFVNRCLLDLPDVYARWWRREHRPFPAEICVIDDGRNCQRPDEEAEARVMLDQVLDDDPELRRVLELQDAGYTREEIAEDLGQSVAAMRSWVNRSKQRIRKEVN